MSKILNSEYLTVQLDELTLEALMDILLFAGQTSAFLANKESSSGRAGEDLIRLTRLANDSADILAYLRGSAGIGEPTSGTNH